MSSVEGQQKLDAALQSRGEHMGILRVDDSRLRFDLSRSRIGNDLEVEQAQGLVEAEKRIISKLPGDVSFGFEKHQPTRDSASQALATDLEDQS